MICVSRRLALLAATGLAAMVATTAQAAEADQPVVTAPAAANQVGEVVVFGRGLAKIGVAQSASEGTITGSDLLVRPLLRVAELLEAVPGMVAAQHSGSGKANQYFLRGFNLDHGSDFTTYIDDVQMNFRTHGHGQGYLDLNGLIPEVITREDFRKGPYRADGGDFALAGAAYMTTIDSYDSAWGAVEAGSFGAGRVAAGGTVGALGAGELTLVGEIKVYNGPWKQPENLRHYAGFAKYTRELAIGKLELTSHVYSGDWKPTEQIPERIIGSKICPSVYCSPDPSATGETKRLITSAKLSGQGWHLSSNAQYYRWNMYSNPTYADDSGASAQIHQFDSRFIYGLKAEKFWEISSALDLTVGTENRFDDITKVGVDHTIKRQFVSSFGFYAVKEGSASVYSEATWRPFDGLRLNGGIRADYYTADIGALSPEAAALGTGSSSASIVSPKLGAAYKIANSLEVYANWGRGFHSNDVRGTVYKTGPIPLLVAGTGSEAGVRYQISGFNVTATYWKLDVGSELKFVGDSNAVEPTGASTRHGYELVGFWRPREWLAIDASYTASNSRYDNGDHIPNAFESAASAGVSAVLDKWEASVRLRRLGPSPLIEDNSQRDPGSMIWNARVAYKMPHVQLYGELLNLLDSKDKDITYFYESYIPGFDSAPTEGRVARVVEPRTLRIGAKYTF
ncbi:MAG: TonB-dependent receptor [Alphaproteobacteria bacterium]